MSHIFGTMLNAERIENYSPVTVMPSCGVHDRVPTPEEGMFFEVPGQWGDDSKYLVGLSTALIVFEPYGYWTNIEIANGLAQDKPVVIIANPELVDSAQVGDEYHALKDESAEYIEKPFELPNGTPSNYRVYKDAGAAAKWINSISPKQLDQDRANLIAGIQEVSITSSTTSIMEGLGTSASGKTPVMDELEEVFSLEPTHATSMDELEEFFSLEPTPAISEPVEDEHEAQKRAEGEANEVIEDDEKVLPRSPR